MGFSMILLLAQRIFYVLIARIDINILKALFLLNPKFSRLNLVNLGPN